MNDAPSAPLPLPEGTPAPPPVPLWRRTMDEQRESGIGGALILVAMGRVLAPVLTGFGLYRNAGVLFEPGVWAAMTTPGAPNYHPLWAGMLVYEAVGWTGLFLTSLLLLWLFFTWRRAFVPTIIAYQAVLILFKWGDVFLGANIPVVRENALFGSLVGAAVQTTVVGAFWIPYFLVSERVRNTFVR